MKSKKKYDKKILITDVNYKNIIKTSSPNHIKGVCIYLIIFGILGILGLFTSEKYESSDIKYFFLGYTVICIFVYYLTIIINRISKKIYFSKINKMFSATFYEDYIQIENNIYGYKTIENYYENDDIMYFKINKELIAYFNKEVEDKDFLDFIREKILDNKEYIPVKKKYKTPIIILNILFWLTIISLFLSTFIPSFITTIMIPNGLLKYFPDLTIEILFIFQFNVKSMITLSYMEYSLYLFIIPFTSFILAKYYKRKGIKCTKNIVSSIIIGLFILMISIGLDKYKVSISYEKFSEYEKIINVPISKNDTFYQYENYDKHIISAVLLKNKNIANIVKNDKNWVRKYNINKDLQKYTLDGCDIDVCYYKIFIKELNDYNTYFTDVRRYTIYSMQYNEDENTIVIDEFKHYYDGIK